MDPPQGEPSMPCRSDLSLVASESVGNEGEAEDAVERLGRFPVASRDDPLLLPPRPEPLDAVVVIVDRLRAG